MSSDEELVRGEPIIRYMKRVEREHVKLDDMVEFEHDGEIVTALVKNVCKKKAQVKSHNIGDVVWKSKKNLTLIREL